MIAFVSFGINYRKENNFIFGKEIIHSYPKWEYKIKNVSYVGVMHIFE